MSLAEALQAQTLIRKGPRCSVAVLFETMNVEDAEEFRTAMSSLMPATAIWRALVAEGYQIGSQSLTRHRNYECFCARKA